jgi:hypothetical protein
MNTREQIYKEFSKMRKEAIRIKSKYCREEHKEKLQSLKEYNRALHEELWKN